MGHQEAGNLFQMLKYICDIKKNLKKMVLFNSCRALDCHGPKSNCGVCLAIATPQSYTLSTLIKSIISLAHLHLPLLKLTVCAMFLVLM